MTDLTATRMVTRRTGGPEVIEAERIVLPPPAAGEVRLRQSAIGLNFIDTYRRSGLYPVDLPAGMGTEGAGTVEAVGAGVGGFVPGDRVAYATSPLGAYADRRNVPASSLVRLPDAIREDIAAAAMLKGLTAGVLVERCAQVAAGQLALVHAAAGGVGSILVQWLHHIGATVIAHAGSADKAARARSLGADHVLSCPFDALADEVRALTGGRGVNVVFDGVGKASAAASLAATAKLGLVVFYGNASGPVPPIDVLELTRRGSLFVTRPTFSDYLDGADALQSLAERLFVLIADGSITIEIGRRYPLANAADAHRALEARQTIGSTLLIP